MDREGQQRRILQLLVDNRDGIASFNLTYNHSIKQAPTRIFELRQAGFKIASLPYSTPNGTRTVRYRLDTPVDLIDWDALRAKDQDQGDLFN